MSEPKRPGVLRVMGWTECTKIESYMDHLEAENQRLREHAERLRKALGLLLSFHESVGSPSPAAPCELARVALEAYRRDYPKEKA